MKKFLIISSLLALVSSAAMAKTEGSYAGVDIINTKVKFVEKFSSTAMPSEATNSPSTSDSAYNLGLSYKYAINHDGFFIAPGVFVENNDVTVNNANQRAEIEHRYGVTADLGYDVTEKIGLYAMVGYAGVDYKNKNGTSNSTTAIKDGAEADWLWGVGLKHNCSANSAMTLEYNTQKLDLKTSTNVAGNYAGHFDTRIDVLKLGFAYRF